MDFEVFLKFQWENDMLCLLSCVINLIQVQSQPRVIVPATLYLYLCHRLKIGEFIPLENVFHGYNDKSKKKFMI
jgi:hypothetical protein